MSDREAMKEALRLLTKCAGVSRLWQVTDACDILRAALAAPKQEPVAWMYVNSEGECEQIEYGTEAIDDDSITLLYAAPPAAAPSEDIETLRQEIERLREALQWIASRCPTQFVDLQPHRIHLEAAHDAGACARAALKEVPR